MATYSLIQAYTITTPASLVSFTSVPQTFTDLKVVMSARSSQSSTRENILLGINSYNSDTGFSWVGLYNYGGTSMGSNKSPAAKRILGDVPANTNGSNIFSNAEIYIPNYSVTGTHIVSGDAVVENNGGDQFLGFHVVAFTGASVAVTTLNIHCGATPYNFMAGSKFYLYGIKNS
jgi:hypothetical protein